MEDKRKMGMTDGSRMKGRKAIVEGVQITYDEPCSNERVKGFLTSLKYRGDASIFTASDSNDAPLPDTKLHPLTSGTTKNQSS
jgi:hypothetical protein